MKLYARRCYELNPAIWICIFMPIWLLLITSTNNKKEQQKLIITKIKIMKVGQSNMNEIIRNYIGKECIVYTFQTQVTGIIESMQDNWISIKVGSSLEIINIDYISRIREFPLKKNGKKKSVVLD